MFHKRLMQEFRDNMKYVAGMVATQWLMLIANVFFMYTLAGFISSAADGTAKTADLQKIFIVLACVIAVRAVSTYVNSRLSFAASCNVKSRIRKMVYEKLMRFSGSYREHLSSAEAVQISTVRDLFREICAAVFLQYVSAADTFCHCRHDELDGCGGFINLCTVDTGIHYCCAEICKENAGKILGNIHRAW